MSSSGSPSFPKVYDCIDFNLFQYRRQAFIYRQLEDILFRENIMSLWQKSSEPKQNKTKQNSTIKNIEVIIVSVVQPDKTVSSSSLKRKHFEYFTFCNQEEKRNNLSSNNHNFILNLMFFIQTNYFEICILIFLTQSLPRVFKLSVVYSFIIFNFIFEKFQNTYL